MLFQTKQIFDKDIEKVFPEIFDPLENIPFDRKLHYLQIMITWIFKGTNGITEEDIREVIDKEMSGSPAEAVDWIGKCHKRG